MEQDSDGAESSGPALSDCLAGGGEMGERMRSMDWAPTELGPASTWPQSLRTSIGICLASEIPILIGWGEPLRLLHNDAFERMVGTPDPGSIVPAFERVRERGEAIHSADQLLPINRNGKVEEGYFRFSSSPIRDESGRVRGVFSVASETTEGVLAARRWQILRELAAVQRESATQVCEAAVRVLAANPSDVPFASIQLLEADGREGSRFGPNVLPNFEAAIASGEEQVIGGLPAQPGGLPTLADSALVLPLKANGQLHPLGFLIAGISPKLSFNEAYRMFIRMAGEQLASSLAKVRSVELEHDHLVQTLLASGTALFRCDFNSTAMKWEGDLERTFGGHPAPSIAQFREQIEAEDRRKFDALLEQAKTGESGVASDFRWHGTAGSQRTLRICAKSYPGGGYMLGVVVEISEISRSTERFQTVLNAAPVPMILHDLSGQILEVNRAFTESTGYTREDVPSGREWFRKGRRVAEASLDALLEATHEKIALGGPASREMTVWTKAGERRDWLFHSSTPVAQSHGVPLVVSAATDLTDRKFAEDALRESERRLRRLVESNIVGVIYCDLEKVTEANDHFLEMVGYTREELAAGQINWRDMTPPEFRQVDEQAIRESREKGSSAPFEKEYLRKDGSRVPVLVGPVLVTAAPEWVCLVVDLSRQKQAEAFLQQSNEDLQRFAYAASHDLQEPLRMISSYAELLARHNKTTLDEQSQEYMGFVLQAAKRMRILIQDLLEYSRLTYGRDVNASATDSGCVLELALMHLQPVMKESGATVTFDALPVVIATDARLLQIFQNLIGNAIKYRSEAAPRIHVAAQVENDVCTFSVSDNGIGIAPQFHERIFGVFQRLHARSEYEGTGIGLAIVKRIVERLGGRIWVRSEEGQGATFYFTLPVSWQ